MTGKLTVSVHDDIHNQNADGIQYDLWRINNGSNRVNIKHGTITDNSNPYILLQANTVDELGSFEIILYIKDYFESFNEKIHVQDNRIIVAFSMNDLNQDHHLRIFIRPDRHWCTL
ncbi:unnamed protein product [Rotaria magnacalcarata]|uniref:Uncharacterized protein n=1 Tax=Rotaria magnacalcarata TaxID=392030 RepID=A0A816RN49_9BILA|nr:unnamed protein product [Rotaria magnacalcarata]CAF1486439.1 unnamed protein product [Rotaria magnacalcarata]CAF2075394.1 unnamed protein product [Rotaria magnacalcarata]CAF5082718.1 unnamed protein product [Rotaria magnacalcarata]CAF5217772.1 unnamed protein product [Rotaria magnacalcarata]